MALVIDHEKCKGGDACARCVEVCPVQALEIKDKKIEVDQERCIMCGACVATCDQGAISFE